ncbi:MAG: tRNA (adenosine(37)-N6)-dimethylallyltransferase MiaA [Bacteroidia bacterium]
MINKKYNCMVVLGPTASGKTHLACQLAYALNGEIISADSRQVYKHLNIGTGKDLQEYEINGKKIPYHLIDIRKPGEQFYLHEFMELCLEAFNKIQAQGKLPVICGGTGLYLDSLRKDFSLTQVKENPILRKELEKLSKEELWSKLQIFPSHLTDHTDINSVKRLIRAIEVAHFVERNPDAITSSVKIYQPFYIGIDVSIEERKRKITERLISRINNGLIEETEDLLKDGIPHERLEFLGLEYKFTSLFIRKLITREEFIKQLQTAIFQFSKRQMTWFRKMEKEGVKIHWIRPGEPFEKVIELLEV